MSEEEVGGSDKTEVPIGVGVVVSQTEVGKTQFQTETVVVVTEVGGNGDARSVVVSEV